MPDQPNSEPRRSAVCFVVDGLHSGFLGAYGNAGILSPNCDRLACESVLFDRYYLNSTDLASTYREFWFGRHPGADDENEGADENNLPERLTKEGYRTILLTDEPTIADTVWADGFAEVCLIDAANSPQVTDSPEETGFFRLLTAVFEKLAEIPDPDKEPFFLWCHWKGFAGAWDFPLSCREEYVEDEDPPPYAGTEPPFVDERSAETEPDPDVLRSVVEAYSGGITFFDELLGGFLQTLREGELGKRTLFALTSAQGYPMGEHRVIGLSDSDKSISRLWSENVHLPLFLRFPDGFAKMERRPALTQPNDLYATFWHYLLGSDPVPSPDQEKCSDLAGRNLLPLISGETESLRQELLIADSEGSRAMITAEWFLKETKNGRRLELYAKPDDRWDVNEVSNRCGEQIETLRLKFDR